ncbi:hypothetical protein GVAV_002737 [Gurleya vavrai]
MTAVKQQIEIILQSKVCLNCLNKMKLIENKQNLMRCGKNRCRKKKSTYQIFTKQPFLNSKLSFDTIIEILRYFFLDLKIKQIKILTNISRKTIKNIIIATLRIIKKNVKKNRVLLGGEDVIVECD